MFVNLLVPFVILLLFSYQTMFIIFTWCSNGQGLEERLPFANQLRCKLGLRYNSKKTVQKLLEDYELKKIVQSPTCHLTDIPKQPSKYFVAKKGIKTAYDKQQ